jgi:3-oxoacyl-[acyl-carrier protein] reductase
MIEGWSVSDGLNSRPLAGEVALVTGALGGLGREMTMALAAAGATVVVHHLAQADLADVFVSELMNDGAIAIAVEADVTDWIATEAMYSAIEIAVGPVSILVNNAGVMREQKFLELSLEEWEETIRIDLNGVFIATRLAAPAMQALGKGTIVMVSSQLAFKGAHDYVSYSAAKGGVASFTKALARELGPNIRVNAIAPGPIETPMTAEYSTPEWVAARTQGSVLGRLGRAEEIAPAVVFLASSGASLMHGQVLHLNGGGVM